MTSLTSKLVIGGGLLIGGGLIIGCGHLIGGGLVIGGGGGLIVTGYAKCLFRCA